MRYIVHSYPFYIYLFIFCVVFRLLKLLLKMEVINSVELILFKFGFTLLLGIFFICLTIIQQKRNRNKTLLYQISFFTYSHHLVSARLTTQLVFQTAGNNIKNTMYCTHQLRTRLAKALQSSWHTFARASRSV